MDKKFLKSIAFSVKHLRKKLLKSNPSAVFLHIPKNGGTTVKHAIKNSHLKIEISGHSRTAININPEAKFFFSVRNPIDRFNSAFYYRKSTFDRRSTESIVYPFQQKFLDMYESANDIAENLFEPGDRGTAARGAMLAIKHLNSRQSHWVHPQIYLNNPNLVNIIRIEHLATDLADTLNFIAEKIVAKPEDFDDLILKSTKILPKAPLSQTARSNLEHWFSDDFQFYKDCLEYHRTKSKTEL